MRGLHDEPVEALLARLPEADCATLTDQLGRAVLSASHAAACLARTGRHRDATIFQLLAFLTAAQRELQAAEQLLRERLLAGDEPEPRPL
jgi:hypothetical protein